MLYTAVAALAIAATPFVRAESKYKSTQKLENPVIKYGMMLKYNVQVQSLLQQAPLGLPPIPRPRQHWPSFRSRIKSVS